MSMESKWSQWKTTKCLYNMVSYWIFQKKTWVDYSYMLVQILLITPLLFVKTSVWFVLVLIFFFAVIFYILSLFIIHIYDFNDHKYTETSKCIASGNSLLWLLKHPYSFLASPPKSIKVIVHSVVPHQTHLLSSQFYIFLP